MTTDHPDAEPLNFLLERDDQTTSWRRSRPTEAIIESVGVWTWTVLLPDGDHAHRCGLATDPDGEYRGWCDCDGFRHHDGPCAHLCAIRKAEFAQVEDAYGRPVTVHDADTIHRVRADGGRHVVERDPAGADERQFGRPEGRL